MPVTLGVSDHVYALLDKSSDLTLSQVFNLSPNMTKNTVKTAYYRWRRKHAPPKPESPKQSVSKKSKVSQKFQKKSKSKSKSKNKDKNLNKTNSNIEPILPDYLLNLAYFSKQVQSINATWKPADVINVMKERNKFQIQQKKEIIEYHRPSFFTQKQQQIMDSIQLTNLAVEGDRQTGKTTSVFAGISEYLISHECDCHFICSNGNNAITLFRKVTRDKNMQYLNKYYAFGPTGTRCSFKNIHGSTSSFIVHNTTVNDIKGGTGFLWMDEVDQIIKNNPEVIAAAVALTRSNPELHIVFSMNKGRGAYTLLIDVLKKEKFKDKIQFLTLERDESFLINLEEDNDEFIEAVMEATMGEDYVRQQMRNETTSNGDIFDVNSINDAYLSYNVAFDEDIQHLRVLAIDPSGTGHPFGYFACDYDAKKDELYEIESGMMQLGLDKTGEKWSTDRINQFFYDLILRLGIKYVVVESNTGGPTIFLFLKGKKFKKVYYQNFGSDKNMNSRENYIKLLRIFLDERRIFLKNKTLKSQLIIYNPKKSNEKFKGDIADALLHALWKSVNGMSYLMKIYKNKNKIEQKVFAK